MKASEWLVAALANYAAHAHFFGVGGANIEDTINAVVDAGYSAWICKHEFSAATMADGFARACGQPGIVVATSGGAALNLVAALAESMASRVPVIAVIGQPPVALEGAGAFQETTGRAGTFDLEQVLSPVAKRCRRVNVVEDLGRAVAEVCAAVDTEPRGPGVLLVPKDIQTADASRIRVPPPLRPGRIVAQGAPTDVALSEGRTLFVIGEDVPRAGVAAPLRAYIERTGARACVTVQAKEAFPADHPLFVGITGIMGHEGLCQHVLSAGQVVILGTRMPLVDRYGIETELLHSRVVHIHIEAPFVRGPSWTHVPVHAGAAVRRWFSPDVDRRSQSAWPWSLGVPGTPAAGTTSSHLRLTDLAPVLGALGRSQPVCWAVDAGNAAAALARDLVLSPGSRFIMALGMGGMGYSFGAGIGACIATGVPTVVFAGDGSFFMHGSEILTAVDADLPVLFVLADNGGHAMCVTRDQLFFARSPGDALHRFRGVDLEAGLRGLYPTLHVEGASTRGELELAIERVSAFDGPAALVLSLDPDEMPLFRPFIDALAAQPLRSRHAHARS